AAESNAAESNADEPAAREIVVGDAATDTVVQVDAAADGVGVGESAESAATAQSGRLGRPLMIALAVAGFAAMTLEIGNGDWAAFRLGDDLDAAAGVASAAFVAFTVGMTIGRFGGDFVLVRIGGRRLAQVAAIVAGVASAVATLVPVTAAAFVGFVVAGLGVSVLFPGLYDAAARTPNGSGFASMLVGQRSATIVVPLAIGALADTPALNIGQAMAIMLIPAAVASFAATTALSR
ncbi:MAG: hypothetical protein AAFY28_15365, partial [Actinomycetota bacterium]